MKTTLLLDVDGVINPDKVDHRFIRKDSLYSVMTRAMYPMTWNIQVLNALNKFIRQHNITLKWSTTWCSDYVELNEALSKYGFPAGTPAFEVSSRYLVCDQKLQAYHKECAEADFVIWIDDDAIPDGLVPHPNSKLIRTDCRCGLTVAEIRNLEFALATMEKS